MTSQPTPEDSTRTLNSDSIQYRESSDVPKDAMLDLYRANNWSSANWSRYCNPVFDALYEESTRELDPDKRRQLIVRMNDLLIEDVAVIPMVERALAFGISTRLEGVEPTPWDVDVWNIKDWRGAD